MRAENELVEQKQQEKQKALYKQELAWMRAGAKARTTKQVYELKNLSKSINNKVLFEMSLKLFKVVDV